MHYILRMNQYTLYARIHATAMYTVL